MKLVTDALIVIPASVIASVFISKSVSLVIPRNTEKCYNIKDDATKEACYERKHQFNDMMDYLTIGIKALIGCVLMACGFGMSQFRLRWLSMATGGLLLMNTLSGWFNNELVGVAIMGAVMVFLLWLSRR